MLPRYLYSPSTPAEVRARLAREFLAAPPGFAATAIEPLYRHDLRDLARRVRVPVRSIVSDVQPVEVVARALGSDRGQAGLLVAAPLVGATAPVERSIGGAREEPWTRRLGLGAPAASGVVRSGAQAGIAEEVLFRAFLFGNLRRGRPFWTAAALALAPFVLVHLWLFVSQPWAVALALVLLSAALHFPLARLFDAGGRTIWGPALLHTVVQGVPRIVSTPEGDATFALTWIACCAVLPCGVFLPRRPGRA